jgi:UDP-N-acetylmuramate dehydrogenase
MLSAGMDFEQNIALAPFTTFHIGGPARWLARAEQESDIPSAVEFARSNHLPLFVLGGGSNLLVRDEGFDGIVVHIATSGITRDGALLHVAAGENWDAFVSHTVALGLGGVECLAGIPGTVGATPVQNVGAYGQEVAETISKVRAYDTRTGQFVTLEREQCGFAYRSSIFNSTERGRYIVTEVTYRLRPDAAPNLTYADLQRRFPAASAPALTEVAAAVREIRNSKGMLIVPGEADCRSAGSFFKNPVVSQAHYDRIAAESAARVPSYPAPNGVKLAAAWLVEQAGFPKGYGNERAGISSRHTLALVNRGHASTKDILALRDEIVAGVKAKFAIVLEMEPVLLG